MILSFLTWACNGSSRSLTPASIKSWSVSHSDNNLSRKANCLRHAPWSSNSWLKLMCRVLWSEGNIASERSSGLLADRAVIRGPLPLPDRPDGGGADPARQPLAAVRHGIELKVTVLALRTGEVAQGAPTQGHGALQHRHNGTVQARRPGFAQSIGPQRGADARHEQRLGSIDIPHPHHDIARQQHLFDAGAALAQGLVKGQRLKTRLQRLLPQSRQQLVRTRIVQRRHVHHGTKPAGVVQAQTPPAGVQFEMVTSRGCL